MTSTYLLEQNDLLREGLKSYLIGTDFHVTAESDCVDGIDIPDTTFSPDLVIVGIYSAATNLPLPKPKDFISLVRNRFTQAKLVILASVEEIRLTPGILYCNADGYILRDISRDAILNYLNLAMIGEKAMPGSVAVLFPTLRMEEAPGMLSSSPAGLNSLSGRENDIVKCLVLGESNKLIARRLDITESTVKGHLKIILRKLGVRNRTQAALFAFSQLDEQFPISENVLAA